MCMAKLHHFTGLSCLSVWVSVTITVKIPAANWPAIVYMSADNKNNVRCNAILGDPGADSGAEDENENGREKIRRAKYERKIRAPGDKLFMHQFQTAKRILAPDWAENFSAQSGASIFPCVSEDDVTHAFSKKKKRRGRRSQFVVFLPFAVILNHSNRDYVNGKQQK